MLSFSFSRFLLLGIALCSLTASLAQATAPIPPSTKAIVLNTPIQLVKEPTMYLKKKVEFTGILSGFSDLGLSYPPVKRDLKDYVSLTIYRPDVPSSYEIPMSELKIFVNRKLLKEFKRIGQGDTIKVSGFVISTALGDAWLEASEVQVLKSVQKEDTTMEEAE
jgi:hypothetical protein